MDAECVLDRKDEIAVGVFVDLAQLLTDFDADVDRWMNEYRNDQR